MLYYLCNNDEAVPIIVMRFAKISLVTTLHIN